MNNSPPSLLPSVLTTATTSSTSWLRDAPVADDGPGKVAPRLNAFRPQDRELIREFQNTVADMAFVGRAYVYAVAAAGERG